MLLHDLNHSQVELIHSTLICFRYCTSRSAAHHGSTAQWTFDGLLIIVDLLYKLWMKLKHGTKRSFETCGGVIDFDSLSQGLLVDSKSTHVSGTWSTINCPSTSTRPLAWSWDGETLGFQGFSGCKDFGICCIGVYRCINRYIPQIYVRI